MNELLQLLQSATSNPDNPLLLVLGLGSLSLLPVILMSTTSFVKISVVLSIFRNALGAGQLPSTAISGLLSLALSLHIMAPVFSSMIESGNLALEKLPKDSSASFQELLELPPTELAPILGSIFSPLQDFLKKHAFPREREFFATLHTTSTEEESDCGAGEACWEKEEGVFTLLPAFILSELQSAFAIGFSIFLPFLVIDLVIANLLVGMGMVMVSPVTISLPFKLLLFVSCDGWFLLCQGLIASYTP